MIEDNNQYIILSEQVGNSDIRRFGSILYQKVTRYGYPDITLNFRKVSACFQDFMVPACAMVNKYRDEGVGFELILPEDHTLRNLFINSNWAHSIDNEYSETAIEKFDHVPLQRFRSLTEQTAVVNGVIRAVLSKVQNVERDDLDALEWTLNEITDNVMTHSLSAVGGFAQCTIFNRRIEVAVCDQGVGIPGTLKRTQPHITNDMKALEYAIKQGVTRDKAIGQGNGLFGAWEITRLCNGDMSIQSGRAMLNRKDGRLKIEEDKRVFSGTLVVWSINLGYPDLLKKAMSFGGKPYVYTDFLETNYETDEDTIQFRLLDEAPSVGARLGNEDTRNKLRNLLHMYPNKVVVVDCEGFNLISSSFADEVFAKLIVEVGMVSFFHRVRFKNVNDLTVRIIDRAIIQRLKESA